MLTTEWRNVFSIFSITHVMKGGKQGTIEYSKSSIPSITKSKKGTLVVVSEIKLLESFKCKFWILELSAVDWMKFDVILFGY